MQLYPKLCKNSSRFWGGFFGNLFSLARLKKQGILLPSPARKWCLYFGKIKLLTCAIVVIIRAITLFSFIHSGFARGCQLLQQQLAWPGGGGTNSLQRIQITGCISWRTIYDFYTLHSLNRIKPRMLLMQFTVRQAQTSLMTEKSFSTNL